MDTKIFLQGFDSKKSSNTSEGLNVEFKGRRKLLPLDGVAEVISQYDQYKEEREKCNILRLTFQVNPICSNVLFNRVSEVVKNEGSSGASFINYGVYGLNTSNPCEYKRYSSDTYSCSELFDGIVYKRKSMEFWSGGTMHYQGNDDDIKDMDSNSTILTAITTHKTHSTASTIENIEIHPTNAIRDTQLSNKTTNFVYHCGLDIFNNHLIRSNTFKTVCKMPNDARYKPANSYKDEYGGFNTIVDLMRDVSGNKVVEKICFPIDVPVDNHARLVALHLYEYDDLYTFNDCVKNRLISKYNGWVGFENRSKIKSYINFKSIEEDGNEADKEMEIERPIMYMNGGDFVDMYPGRELYSFVPKYNTFRKRIEKNWNYCITYPSSSYTPSNNDEPFSDIIECSNGINSMKTIYFNENTRADNGTTQLVMYSIAKHGLSQGDYVNIYKTYKTKKYWVVDNENDKNRISDIFNTEAEANDECTRIKKEGITTDECEKSEPIGTATVTSTTKEETYTDKILDNAEVAEIVDDYIFTVFNANTQISKYWVNLSKSELKGNTPLVVTIGNTQVTYNLDQSSKKFFRKQNDIESKYYIVNDEYVNLDDTAQKISYKKVVNDIECDYYIRIFSKLPNFKNASGDTSNEYQLYKDNEKIIHEYQDKKYDFENHISRLAFAKNIYTDEVGEIVFTDDIDISNLHDNLGRPLTSLYITFIKNNKGYKEWYGYKYADKNWDVNEINDETVEFSHAFGKITCGIKTSEESMYDNSINSINKINNIGVEDPIGYMIGNVINDNNRGYTTSTNKKVEVGQEEVWYDTDKNFYGDLCYYDNYNAIERHVDYIMHRFNTAQRESNVSQSVNYFKNFYYDEIVRDDYDSSDTYGINSYKFTYGCNNKKEGYYYNPHYEIPIKTFDKLQTIMPDFLTIKQFVKIDKDTYNITTLQQHFLSVGDKTILYDSVNDVYYNLITVSGESDNYRVFTCKAYKENGDGLSEEIKVDSLQGLRLFKMDNLDAPSYCRVLKDGTCRVIWRNVLNNGFNQSDDSVEEYPFTNGAFYINKKIDIYLRRQDPHGLYGLYEDDDIYGNSTNIEFEDNYIKESDIEC